MVVRAAARDTRMPTPMLDTTIVALHIATGTIAVLAGLVAGIARKGANTHRAAGKVFLISMGAASLAGAVLGLYRPDQFITFFAGLLSLYLLATGWMAATRRGQAGLPEIAALVCIAAIGSALAMLGVDAMNAETGLRFGYSAEPYFFLAAIAFIGAVLDLAALVRHGVQGAQRVARHLWRMCFAYFIAAGSLFTGPGATAFPEPIRNSGALSLPEPAILIFMLSWLGAVLFISKKGKRQLA